LGALADGALMERVLFAVDDSVESLAAARYGARLAAGWNAAVRILTAVPESPPETNAVRGTGAERLVEHVVREVRAAGVAVEKSDAVVPPGEAFRCILEEARAWRADLIVMAVSHRTGLRSPYVGSQTEHVLEFSTCPILVVPGPASSPVDS
jgi:nucleotide-binding universal stress UspA family protein